MGVATTMFSETDWSENGRFACDLACLIKQSGQEVPKWLSEGITKYLAIAQNERSFLSNLFMVSLIKFCKLLLYLCTAIPFQIYYVLQNICCCIQVGFNIFKTVVKFGILFFIPFIATYIVLFGCDTKCKDFVLSTKYLYSRVLHTVSQQLFGENDVKQIPNDAYK